MCVSVYERESKFVCALQEQVSVDSERVWHSACQTVCVWLEDRSVGLPTPLLQSGICPLVY